MIQLGTVVVWIQRDIDNDTHLEYNNDNNASSYE